MKIECDELLVICDNCGHAIHVKELDNNLIKLNNKNDKLISEQDVIDALIEWYGCEPNGMDDFVEILAKKSSAQPVDKDINVPINDTISRKMAIDAVETIGFDFSDSGLSAVKIEEVCEAIGEVRQAWSLRIKLLPSAQPEIIRCKDCKYSSPNKVYGCRLEHFDTWEDGPRMYSDDFCSYAERRTNE